MTDIVTTSNFQMNLFASRWLTDIRRDMDNSYMGDLTPQTALAFHQFCQSLRTLIVVTEQQLLTRS